MSEDNIVRLVDALTKEQKIDLETKRASAFMGPMIPTPLDALRVTGAFVLPIGMS